MKLIVPFFGFLLLTSCSGLTGSNQEKDELNKRITLLEHRVDSLVKTRNIDSVARNITGIVLVNDRCQALTKKGTQCRRKARNNTFCWQHGG